MTGDSVAYSAENYTPFYMLKLKTISLLEHRSELDALPEGKLLINTINAHSYNTALKDPAFAEALLRGDALIPDGASIVLAFKLLRHEKIERTAGWDLFLYEMDKLNRKGGTCFFLGSSEDTLRKIKVKAVRLYPNIRVETYSPPYKPEFTNSRRKPGTAGFALGGHDRSQTREMDLYTPERTGGKRSHRYYWRCVRLLCRKRATCSRMVAGTRVGMAVPADKGTQKNVEKIYHRELLILMEYHKREIYIIT